MSYNIDTWKTKKIKDLVIPMRAFFKHERKDWHPEVVATGGGDGNDVVLKCGCGQEIIGNLKGGLEDGQLTVLNLDMSGEGSGTFYNWIFEPALHESTGELEAVQIWEGGDSVTKLTVKDGKVRLKDIEL